MIAGNHRSVRLEHYSPRQLAERETFLRQRKRNVWSAQNSSRSLWINWVSQARQVFVYVFIHESSGFEMGEDEGSMGYGP
jgi:hypothetical protein